MMNHAQTRLAEIVGVGLTPPSRDFGHSDAIGWVPEAIYDARKRAKRKALPFDLSRADVMRMMVSQGYRCSLSGVAFSTLHQAGAHKRPFMPSLDRRDCSKGYTRANTRIVCVAVNTLLQDWGDAVYHAIIAAAKK